MNEIIISGTTGVGKTEVANWIFANPELEGLRVLISDHALFASEKGFSTHLEKIKQKHLDGGADISILVINDGGRGLKIEFSNRAGHSVLERIFCKAPISQPKQSI